MAVLDYSPKLKWTLGLTFGAHFLHDFSLKMFLVYQMSEFQCHTFFASQNIKQNVLLSSYLGS